jgi:sRNA-binding regulator protein Hfq
MKKGMRERVQNEIIFKHALEYIKRSERFLVA